LATAAAGQTISAIGSFMEIGINIISSGDTNGASKAIINNGISKVVDKVVDVIVPGPTPSATKVYNETMKVTKVITKEVMNKGLEFK